MWSAQTWLARPPKIGLRRAHSRAASGPSHLTCGGVVSRFQNTDCTATRLPSGADADLGEPRAVSGAAARTLHQGQPVEFWRSPAPDGKRPPCAVKETMPS
jgi:hypothetical protein